MRTKDNQKHTDICNAAITLINSKGFAESSISKIAKMAGVSASSIYVYFQNKEDMLNKVYIYAKQTLFEAISLGVNFHNSTEESFKTIYFNYYNWAVKNPDLFLFCEQFSNSPLINKMSKHQADTIFNEISGLIERGIEEHTLVVVLPELIAYLFIAPLVGYIKDSKELASRTKKNHIEMLYSLSWKAICQ